VRAREAGRRLGAWARAWAGAPAAPEFLDLLADLERSLSPRQRAHAIARLRGYGRDFQELAVATR